MGPICFYDCGAAQRAQPVLAAELLKVKNVAHQLWSTKDKLMVQTAQQILKQDGEVNDEKSGL
jgi:hypothetical protein